VAIFGRAACRRHREDPPLSARSHDADAGYPTPQAHPAADMSYRRMPCRRTG
jgi:hypothetical protein